MGNHCCRCFGGKDSNDLEETLIASTNTSDAGMDAPSPGATAAAATLPRKGARSGLRAFLIVRHCDHGYLLLEACKKRKGGRHFQLPGGHVDAHELEQYGDAEGSRIAAARELHEETGIDFRDRLYRLNAVDLLSMGPEACKLHQAGRRYVKVDISNADSVDDLSLEAAAGSVRLATPLTMQDFRLCLSREHTGFRFEKSAHKAAELVEQHSGGTSSLALMLIQEGAGGSGGGMRDERRHD